MKIHTREDQVLIEVKNLTKKYGTTTAVDDVSFKIRDGMIYVLLPFMFLSVYQVAEKLDLTLVEAARDLGAGKLRAFLTVTLPLTLPGLKTGIILTFIPSMGLFFIASILGGNKVVLIGSLIEEQLMRAHNQPFAAALSVALMLLTGVVCGLLMRKRSV